MCMYEGRIYEGVSKTPAASEIESFVASIKLNEINVMGSSILHFAGGLDAHLMYMYIFIHMKTMCPPGYHCNCFKPTHALEQRTNEPNSAQQAKQ